MPDIFTHLRKGYLSRWRRRQAKAIKLYPQTKLPERLGSFWWGGVGSPLATLGGGVRDTYWRQIV